MFRAHFSDHFQCRPTDQLTFSSWKWHKHSYLWWHLLWFRISKIGNYLCRLKHIFFPDFTCQGMFNRKKKTATMFQKIQKYQWQTNRSKIIKQLFKTKKQKLKIVVAIRNFHGIIKSVLEKNINKLYLKIANLLSFSLSFPYRKQNKVEATKNFSFNDVFSCFTP